MASLSERLDQALVTGDFESVRDGRALDDRDALNTLLSIYDLHVAPVDQLDGREQHQHHPVVAELKTRYDDWFIHTLDIRLGAKQPFSADIAEAMRRIARQSNDSVYEWLATDADWDQMLAFLAVEGGPDGGFDDLVALCQVGIRGPAKVVLGENYWDEMGRGDNDEVHTVLHDRLVDAMQLPRFERHQLPVDALARAALNGLLATNRHLQPEMLGALGLLELQAGPRCRQVLRAFERLDAPKDAFPFYAEHAQTDPRHGKEWLEGALRPLVEEHPEWADRIVRGARWRADVNNRLFRSLHTLLATRELRIA